MTVDVSAYKKQWYLDNKEKVKANQKKYYLNNKEKISTNGKQYRLDNKEKIAEYNKQYQRDNPGKVKTKANKRRSSKLQRTPVWADHLVISMIYEDCPEGYQVDHIIPLQGKNVSGLHVPWNLQYLTPEENLSKGNRFVVT